jgi:hypothetical protein
LSREAARAILKIDFPENDEKRIRDLAAKARRGALTAEEEKEIDSYGRIGSFPSIMRVKGSDLLAEKQQPPSQMKLVLL